MVTSKKIIFLVLCVVTNACSLITAPKLDQIPKFKTPTQAQRQFALDYIDQEAQIEDFKIIKTGPEIDRVKIVASKLCLAAGFSSDSLDWLVLDDADQVNAMSLNNSAVVIYKALLPKINSENELAVVISHELGHILAQHVKQVEELQATNNGLNFVDSVSLLVSSLTPDSISKAYLNDEQGFNKQEEFEADRIGLILMAKAGFDPKAAIGFWARAESFFNKDGQFLDSHPSEGSRVEALKTILPIALKFYNQKLSD